MHESALFWGRELAGDKPALHRLGGGLNNDVYHLSSLDREWVIKVYLRKGQEGRRRINAETSFLRYCEMVAPEYIPRLLSVDRERMCIVQEYVRGERFQEGEMVSQESIGHAFRFFGKLNRQRDDIREGLDIVASEGYPLLTDHILAAKRRLRMVEEDERIEGLESCIQSLVDGMRRDLEKVTMNIERAIKTDAVDNKVREECRCISPSDFGLHNAIKVGKNIKFIDFEFAGWDDAAKTLCDFVMQPRVPVGRDWRGLLDMLPNEHRPYIEKRARIVAPLHYIKWRCMITSCLSSSRYQDIGLMLGTKDRERIISYQMEVLRRFEAKWDGIIA